MHSEKGANGADQLSDEFSDDGAEDFAQGDYSTRMQELLGEDGEQVGTGYDNDDEEAEESFVYAGIDAPDATVAGYRDQLRDVLESDADSVEDAEQSLLIDPKQGNDLALSDDELMSERGDILPSDISRANTPDSISAPMRLPRPVLHPNVSRLRSFTPQSMSIASSHSAQSNMQEGLSPLPSHFSGISPTSSVSNLRETFSTQENASLHKRDVFKWAPLHGITGFMFSQSAQKAASVLGSSPPGVPTVLAANGLICVGTEEGMIAVYDFKQTLKCMCGDPSASKLLGSVTALALSHDHTYVASGHASGHIQLFDLKAPRTPTRTVVPTTLAAIYSGRKEGHIQGSKIVNVGFVAGRHTAIVSADEHGLAFSHSLGKVLFVEASDILRILGKYPIKDAPHNVTSPVTPSPVQHKSRYTILAMMPLPLGTAPHSTDEYNLIALLTPTKLVVVGLKPTPKTWFKSPRGSNVLQSRGAGTLVWFPSVVSSEKIDSTSPRLAYSWANVIYVLQVEEAKSKETKQNPRNSKIATIEVGRIVSETIRSWTVDTDVLALQWLNVKQILAFTSTHIYLFDIGQKQPIEHAPFHASILSPLTTRPDISHSAHRVRTYKGKIFLLSQTDLQVGSLLTWVDRILFFVQNGDFLSAIDLARSYYSDEAPGNRNGLPDDPLGRKAVTGQRMRDLMVASARYAFSEDRMSDDTHFTPDGRGVDRTSLFEGIVTTCARACIALEDFEFLFEDLFQQYDDAGIARIFLIQIEPFILDNSIRFIPPWITQKLLLLQEEDGRPDLVERIIWHIDPECLDLNQAIILCRRHKLYDALIYVYTRGLRDYVAPVVDLIGLIRQINHFRRQHNVFIDNEMESKILNAYKIYPYMANVLSGLTYPSEIPLDPEDAQQAKRDLYTFIFFGHSSMWPPGEGGQLILTSNDESSAEPTYPYARLLLQFDPESFLHSLDIAFEDAYLNDESQGGRLLIVRVLLEILASGDLGSTATTFVNIFIARNAPKYPQFLHITPSQLHNILIGLATDQDSSTREDRQLAAEYLLSVYNPHDSEHIFELFKDAGFYRILRSWYRSDRRWPALLSVITQDPELTPSEILKSVDEILRLSSRGSKNSFSLELEETLLQSLPRLLNASLVDTAILLNNYSPSLHGAALDALADEGQFRYLHSLLCPPSSEDDEFLLFDSVSTPHLEASHRQLFISLQCRFEREKAILVLKSLPSDSLDWEQVITICENERAFDAAVWSTNAFGNAAEALDKAATFEEALTEELVGRQIGDVDQFVCDMQSLSRSAITICLERSAGAASSKASLEDMWFQLLSGQIHCVQRMSTHVEQHPSNPAGKVALTCLRGLVHEAFTSLVSISMTRAISFPHLFKRLVSQGAHHLREGSHYSEFRTILFTMLESYHSDEDILLITKHLVDRDLFDLVLELHQERTKGWRPARGVCAYCRQAVLKGSEDDNAEPVQIVVSRTGQLFHATCRASLAVLT